MKHSSRLAGARHANELNNADFKEQHRKPSILTLRERGRFQVAPLAHVDQVESIPMRAEAEILKGNGPRLRLTHYT